MAKPEGGDPAAGLARLHGAFLLLALLLCVPASDAEPPSPQQSERPSQEGEAQAERRGADTQTVGRPAAPPAVADTGQAGRLEGDPDSGEAQRSGERQDDGPKWTDVVQALSAGIVAVFTFVLTVVSVKQWSAARIAADAALKSAIVAEQTLVYAQRTYVFGVEPVVTWAKDQGDRLTGLGMRLDWVNVGNTLASRAVSHLEVTEFEPAMPPGFAYDLGFSPNPNDPAASIMPRDKLSIEARVRPIEDFLLAWKKRAELYVIGWIEYDDVLPDTDRRRTEVCWRLTVVSDPTVPGTDLLRCLALDRYGPHNGTDQGCFHKPMTRQRTAA